MVDDLLKDSSKHKEVKMEKFDDEKDYEKDQEVWEVPNDKTYYQIQDSMSKSFENTCYNVL